RPGDLTPIAFVRALREGHGYVSRGPLIFPSVMFGTTLQPRAGRAPDLDFELESIAGLRQAELVGNGTVIETRLLPGARERARLKFRVSPEGRARWYQLLVEDAQGRKAYTDPIWVSDALIQQ